MDFPRCPHCDSQTDMKGTGYWQGTIGCGDRPLKGRGALPDVAGSERIHSTACSEHSIDNTHLGAYANDRR